MSQSKVKSGSIKGAGDRVAPYDAMVYQDGTYTIAVDGDGNVIKKVLSSANTDDVVIQAAIDSVGSDPGHVYIKSGYTYVINTGVTTNGKTSVTSNGAHIDLDSFDGVFLTINDTGGQIVSEEVRVSGFVVDGDLSNVNTVGIYVFRRPWMVKIEDVTIKRVSYPIKIEGECYGCVVSHCNINNCVTGITTLKGSGLTSANFTIIEKSNIASCSTYGVDCTGFGYGSSIISCYFEGNGTAILYSTGATRCSIIANYISVKASGIGVDIAGPGFIKNNVFVTNASAKCIDISGGDGTGSYVINNNVFSLSDGTTGVSSRNASYEYVVQFVENYIYPGPGSSAIGETIKSRLVTSIISNNYNQGHGVSTCFDIGGPSSKFNTVTNNTIRGYNIGVVVSAGNSNKISDNYFYGVTTPVSGGTGDNSVTSNFGYATESTGTAATITAGNTYVDVTHSLAATPTKVRVTPTTNLGTRSFWVDTKGASTFRININSSDSIDHTFDWEAEV